MYAVHYLLGVAAAALVGLALGAMIRGIASHLARPRHAGDSEKTIHRSGFLVNVLFAVGAPLAMLGLWLLALTDLATWGQPVLGAEALVGAALGWWAGPGLRDAFTARATYRPVKGRRRRSDDNAPNPFIGEVPMPEDAAGDTARPFTSFENDPPP